MSNYQAGQSASQKLRVFVSEPMGNKDVFQLSGIDKILGQRLVAEGFTHASTVLGMFLVLKRNRWKFQCWICDACCANIRQANECYNCLKEWCEYFL
ncbi:Barrier-to-autointegration factor [Lamellibrachia satsuma]|nr:Barrier-to-autointegration factor [Lamellibrachia satsuma]